MLNVLPTSVRYAATYKGYLGKQEIRDLLLSNMRFIDEAAYLIAEAWDACSDHGSPFLNSQEGFLNALVSSALASDNEVLGVLRMAVANLPDSVRISATRLVEMSWYGFKLRSGYEKCVSRCLAEGSVPTLVAYPCATGIIPIARYQDPFYFMLPDWMGQDECWGYDFDPAIEYNMSMAAARLRVELLWSERVVEKLSLIYFPDRAGVLEAERVRAYLERCGHSEVTCMPVVG